MTVTIIAELGSNHGGVLGEAMALAKAAIEAGADIVKLQDHRWQDIAPDAKHPPWMTGGAIESRADYLARTCFSGEQWFKLSQYVRELGAKFMVSPFSVQALEWHLGQETLDAVKIASGQVTNEALLRAAYTSKLPIYVSSGMSTSAENWHAVGVLARGEPRLPYEEREGYRDGQRDVTYMYCTSEYPCPPEASRIAEVYGNSHPYGATAVGYSDHTMGFAATLAAVAYGAQAIERHVGFDRRGYGSDARVSLTIDEFATLVREVRSLETMLDPPSSVYDDPAVRMSDVRKAFLHGA